MHDDADAWWWPPSKHLFSENFIKIKHNYYLFRGSHDCSVHNSAVLCPHLCDETFRHATFSFCLCVWRNTYLLILPEPISEIFKLLGRFIKISRIKQKKINDNLFWRNSSVCMKVCFFVASWTSMPIWYGFHMDTNPTSRFVNNILIETICDRENTKHLMEKSPSMVSKCR